MRVEGYADLGFQDSAFGGVELLVAEQKSELRESVWPLRQKNDNGRRRGCPW